MNHSRPTPIGEPYLRTLGLQLWTVRNELEKDLPGTLRAIRDAGYAQVELMRLSDAREVVAQARALGLGVTSAFIDWEALVKNHSADLAAQLAIARELGLKYLVFGYIGKGVRETAAHLQAHAANANAFGRQCRDAGIQLCYHHHSFEFSPLADGPGTGWDILVQEFDPALVKLELDVFWLALGGLDPIATLRALQGRVAQVHLKDLAPGTPRNHDEGNVPPAAFRELGGGGLDLKRIIATCAATGVDQCHVEQDQSPQVLADIATSVRYLRRT